MSKDGKDEIEVGANGEIGLSDAIVLATRMQRLGEHAAALQVYERILALVPDHVDALHFSGIAHYHNGQSDLALQRIDASIAADPALPDPHLNRGNILLEVGRLDEAAAAYGRAAELGWNTPELHNNLGVLHRAYHRPDEAEKSYFRALDLDPNYADAHTNLASLYSGLNRIEDAVRHGCLALVSQPQHPGARKLVAIGYYTLGRLEEAAAIYREWLAEEPDNPMPRHYLAACTGIDVPERANDAYVEAIFDGFANSFDAKLALLTYRAPQLVADAVALHFGAPRKGLDVLDAGCGTGLCGPHLAPYAKTLVGVDLSAQMLTKARVRAVYDELVKGELTEFLQSRRQAYDIVASADTLCYFGALDGVIAAAFGALKPGGLLVFTVEANDNAAAPAYTLHPHGRYSHRRDGVELTLAAAGFAQIDLRPDHLRNESGKPVAGWLVTARRPGGDRALSD